MLDPGYVVGVLVIIFAITFALRAVPFAVLEPLRESRFVLTMAIWMPVGVLGVLAASTFRSTAGDDPGHLWKAGVATVVTAIVHLTCGRRTLLSVGLGTATYVVLVNLL